MRKRTERKWISYLLATAMLAGGISLSPIATTQAQAAEASVRNINLNVNNKIAGINNPTQVGNADGEWEGSKVYFGQETGKNLWRVLDVGTGLLFAETVVAMRKYDKNSSKKWDKSDLKRWLNGNAYMTSDSKFSRTEIKAIQTKGNEIPEITLLTIEDVTNPAYGFHGRGGMSYTRSASSRWWLRSPGYSVGGNGVVYFDDHRVDDNRGVRPAFYLNRPSVLFTSASGASKSDTFAVTTESKATTWNMTLRETGGFKAERIIPEAAVSSNEVNAGEEITVKANNLNKVDVPDGFFTQISAMLVDENNTVAAYGKVSEYPSNTSEQSECQFGIKIPDVAPGNYTMKVFAEKVNSSSDRNVTDYGSNMADISLVIKNDSWNQPSDPTNEGEGNNNNTPSAPIFIGWSGNNIMVFYLQQSQGPIYQAVTQTVAQANGYEVAGHFNLLSVNGQTPTTDSTVTGVGELDDVVLKYDDKKLPNNFSTMNIVANKSNNTDAILYRRGNEMVIAKDSDNDPNTVTANLSGMTGLTVTYLVATPDSTLTTTNH